MNNAEKMSSPPKAEPVTNSQGNAEPTTNQQAGNQSSTTRAPQADVKLFPVDEASQDPSFEAFRQKLIIAVKNRDTKWILNILDRKIMNSFGGDGGIKEFKEMWKLDKPDSKIWDTLLTVLTMGGSFSSEGGRKEFCAPYVFSAWFEEIDRRLPTGWDVFNAVAITGENVALRREPNENSPMVDNLSYDIVKMTSDDETRAKVDEEGVGWLQIVTLRGTKGYVNDKNIRSPVDYRACFAKVGSRWLMNALIAGD